jgi:hypothetical protein
MYVIVVPILHTPKNLSTHQRSHHLNHSFSPVARTACSLSLTASRVSVVTTAPPTTAGDARALRRLRRRMAMNAVRMRTSGRGMAMAEASHPDGRPERWARIEGERMDRADCTHAEVVVCREDEARDRCDSGWLTNIFRGRVDLLLPSDGADGPTVVLSSATLSTALPLPFRSGIGPFREPFARPANGLFRSRLPGLAVASLELDEAESERDRDFACGPGEGVGDGRIEELEGEGRSRDEEGEVGGRGLVCIARRCR